MFKWKHLQHKAKTRQQRHLPVLGFEIELILSQTVRTSNEEQQKATNIKWKHAPKTKMSNKKHFFIPSFIYSRQFLQVADIKSHERARTSNEKQRKATKSNEKQQQKTKTRITVEKPNQAIKKKTNKNEQQNAKKLKMETSLNLTKLLITWMYLKLYSNLTIIVDNVVLCFKEKCSGMMFITVRVPI